MRLLLFLIGILPVISLPGQQITGKIIDEKQRPLKSATVLLLKQKDYSLVKSSLSDNDGHFRFDDIKAGKYLVSVTVTGYKKSIRPVEVTDKDVQVQEIALSPDAAVLKDVTVTAVKPFLEQRSDKLIVNVEGSATAAGSTAFEVLQKIPGVMVINDKITVAGRGAPAIMIDGKLSQYTDMSQVLRDMSASNIEKIELITNPGAKYDASGGAIINIIIKKNANLGTSVTIGASGGTGIYDKTSTHTDRNFYRHGNGISINHRKGKLNVFGQYNFMHRNQFEYNEFDRLIPPNRFFQTNYVPSYVNSHTYRLGADFFADRKNTFGFIIRGFSREGLSEAQNFTQQSDASSNQLLSTFQTFNNTQIKRVNTSFNGNWKHSFDTLGREVNLDIDYSIFKLNNNSDIINQLSNGAKFPNLQVIDKLCTSLR